MTTKSKAKVNIPITIFGNHEVPFERSFSAIFRYTDGEICWPVTDFFSDLQRSQLKESSIELYIRPLQDIVDYLSYKQLEFTDANEKMFMEFVMWLQTTTDLPNRIINKRVRHFIELLFYIQDKYDTDKTLIAVTKGPIKDAHIYVEEEVNLYNKIYYRHSKTHLNQQNYTPRSPMTPQALREVDQIIEDSAGKKSKEAEYNSEVLRLSTDIFEATGIRVGELVHMGQATLEIIEEQVYNKNKNLREILDSSSSELKTYLSKDDIEDTLKLIDNNIENKSQIVWLLIENNKSTVNAGDHRFMPINKTLAIDIIDFYRDYVISMDDLILDEDKSKCQRDRSGYIIPQYSGKPFFSKTTENATNGDGKLFSAFYSNHVGCLAKEKAAPHLLRHKFITNIVVNQLRKTEHRDAGTLDVILHRVIRLSGHANPKSLWSYIDIAEIELANQALVKKRQQVTSLEAILKLHNLDLNSDLALQLKSLLK